MSNFIDDITSSTGISKRSVEATVKLLEDGATLPFIARYRKEYTGGLQEIDIERIIDTLSLLKTLSDRKKTILSELEKQGVNNPELIKSIERCKVPRELEDLYLPYRPKRTTLAGKAIEAGLDHFADAWLGYSGTDPLFWRSLSIPIKSENYKTADEISNGIKAIIASRLSENSEVRNRLRKILATESKLCSSVKKDFKDKRTPFEDYYEFSSAIPPLKSHTILALLRGESEGVLKLKFSYINKIIIEQALKIFAPKARGEAKLWMESALTDGLKKQLSPALEKELINELRDRAEKESISIFSKNLENLLMASPAGEKPLLAIDPGFRTGCKAVFLGKGGELLNHLVIYPVEPHKREMESAEAILNAAKTYKPELIAIGNGTGGRETLRWAEKNLSSLNIPSFLVSEAGASVYSASKSAQKEFPDLDITFRGAVSIGRRVQDPLAEIVKIDPKSIGVGQYQHDVNQTDLSEALKRTVVSVVNRVGADLNLASKELLTHIAGLNEKTASAIISYREKSGSFTSRTQLKSVTGIGPKSFEQCAGFLRISNSKNPLDGTAIHPESYPILNKISEKIGCSIQTIIDDPEKLRDLPASFTSSESMGMSLNEIADELQKRSRDPRGEFFITEFDKEINSISDLTTGLTLNGVVTNVTSFGAFVDIGVHQDGLVHISHLSNKFVSTPSDVVKSGDSVRVKVIDIDSARNRIALSIKNA